jgi:hypothetical protein
MNKLSQKTKDWILAKMPHPEAMDANDHKVVDFLIMFFVEMLPGFLGMMFMFSLLSYMYLWGYRKYGIERTVIVMLVNLIIVIGNLGSAVRKLSQ